MAKYKFIRFHRLCECLCPFPQQFFADKDDCYRRPIGVPVHLYLRKQKKKHVTLLGYAHYFEPCLHCYVDSLACVVDFERIDLKQLSLFDD